MSLNISVSFFICSESRTLKAFSYGMRVLLRKLSLRTRVHSGIKSVLAGFISLGILNGVVGALH